MLRIDQARERLLAEGVPAETVAAFIENFLANPLVWRQFERFALDAIQTRRKLGAKAVMERVRWETEIERNEDFKVSNNWTAYYARIFALKHPAYRNYFDFKQVRGVSV
jgi:hypothetical protein